MFPTYKLIIGIPGLSNAISIASNLGLDQELVWKAKELLITQRDNSSVVVEKLQDTQQKLNSNLNLLVDYEKNFSHILYLQNY